MNKIQCTLNFKHNDKARNQHQSLDHKALSKVRLFIYLPRLAPFWWLSSLWLRLQQIPEYVRRKSSSLSSNSMKSRVLCVQAKDDKPIMKAVIGKTFKAQHSVWLPYPCCHQGPSSEITSKCKSKQTMGNATQLYRAETSDGPFLLESPVCAEVGL